MKYPSCQFENPEQNQFCRKCGTKLKRITHVIRTGEDGFTVINISV